jgi:hypothetical protein
MTRVLTWDSRCPVWIRTRQRPTKSHRRYRFSQLTQRRVLRHVEEVDGNRLEPGDKSLQCDVQLYLEGSNVENLLFANFTAPPPSSEPKSKLCAPEYETQVLLTSFMCYDLPRIEKTVTL